MYKKLPLLSILILTLASSLTAQRIFLNQNWKLRYNRNLQQPVGQAYLWLPAKVPGNIYQNLYDNHSIPDPFFSDNEKMIAEKIDSAIWEYELNLDIPKELLKRKKIVLLFEGLDTYAEVFLNQQKIISADNMFRSWQVDIKSLIHEKGNEIMVRFHSAKKTVDSLAKTNLPLYYPDNNRVYARKAQYQFGWDWGPTFIGAGIWKPVWIDAYDEISSIEKKQDSIDQLYRNRKNDLKLIQQKDRWGTSFQFEKDGQPIYMKGANWIPGEAYPGSMTKEKYRHLLTMAKEANMNMLRVWGGGYYEDDYFYELCDSLGIYVWQDFMFACAMYPADSSFLKNVKEEFRQQVLRLRHHPCIAIWCGNNEIDEAWKNWGWQQQYNLHGLDSAKIRHDYQTLFDDSLRIWINEWDSTRTYVSTSPKNGWGHAESFTEGDSHYWGLWWGLEDWEVFKNKTGRFVSEYGMQSMSNYETVLSYAPEKPLNIKSPSIQSHQRANNGFQKLHHYINRYFIDSSLLTKMHIRKYVYLTQCMQAYTLRNVIAMHRSQSPRNMGTLVWQLNDCWPVTSWSIIDYSGAPKAAWYAVKKAYAKNFDNRIDSIPPKDWKLDDPKITIVKTAPNTYRIKAEKDAYFVYVYNKEKGSVFSDNYFDLKKNQPIEIKLTGKNSLTDFKVMSLYDVLGKR